MIKKFFKKILTWTIAIIILSWVFLLIICNLILDFFIYVFTGKKGQNVNNYCIAQLKSFNTLLSKYSDEIPENNSTQEELLGILEEIERIQREQ